MRNQRNEKEEKKNYTRKQKRNNWLCALLLLLELWQVSPCCSVRMDQDSEESKEAGHAQSKEKMASHHKGRFPFFLIRERKKYHNGKLDSAKSHLHA